MKPTRILIAAIVIGLYLPVLAFANEPGWKATKTAELVKQARESTNQVSVEQLKESLEKDDDILVIDVRTAREFDAAHVPGAYNLDRGLLEFSVWSVADDLDENIYVYCRTGARAALAAHRLQELGFTKVNAVATGALDWTKKGYPMQTSILDERVMITPVPD
jgi:rhodanese-related sulfurtransferase